MIFYFILGVGIAAGILYGKKRKPSRLRMRAPSSNLPETYGKTKLKYEDMKQGLKSLDCFFIYNGHEFNAYESLEVPAGAPKEMVEAAYKKLLETADPSQKEFFRIAYEAIQRR